MCIRDSAQDVIPEGAGLPGEIEANRKVFRVERDPKVADHPVSYTHLRAHETVLDLVCRLLLETKKRQRT